MRITGTDDADTLSGTDQADTIRGLGADDLIYSNGGADFLYGGAGDDMIFLRQSGAFAYGQDGDDRFVAEELSLSLSRTLVDGGSGTDTFDASGITGAGDDVIQFLCDDASRRIVVGGYALTDVEVLRSPDLAQVDYYLADWTGPLTIYGGTGSDRVSSLREAAVTFYGGAGDDAVTVRATGTRASGGAGQDLFRLDAYRGVTDVRVNGGFGDDLIAIDATAVDLRLGFVVSNEGVRYSIASIEDVDVSGVRDGSTITGSDAGNLVYVSTVSLADDVTIDGLGGDDIINGSSANDTILGGDGDDFVTGFTGFDVIDGGQGRDFASFGASDQGPLVIRLAESGATRVRTAAGETVGRLTAIEDVGGSQTTDTITGNTLDNQLVGNGGDDRLDGRAGNDTLTGGAGADVLTGGMGADRFAYLFAADSSPASGEADVIRDFSQRDGDTIALDFDANVGTEGVQDFTFIGTSQFSGQAGELRFAVIGGTTFVSADIDGNRTVDMTIKLAGAIALTADDFVL